MGNGTCASHKYATEPLGLSCDYTVIPNCAVAKQDIEDMVSWDIDHLKVCAPPRCPTQPPRSCAIVVQASTRAAICLAQRHAVGLQGCSVFLAVAKETQRAMISEPN